MLIYVFYDVFIALWFNLKKQKTVESKNKEQ